MEFPAIEKKRLSIGQFLNFKFSFKTGILIKFLALTDYINTLNISQIFSITIQYVSMFTSN